MAGLGAGVVLGVMALHDQVPANLTTRPQSQGGPTDDSLRSQQHGAHEEAVAADIGLGVGLVAAVAAGYLYFARQRVTLPSTSAVSVLATPYANGGALLLKGSF